MTYPNHNIPFWRQKIDGDNVVFGASDNLAFEFLNWNIFKKLRSQFYWIKKGSNNSFECFNSCIITLFLFYLEHCERTLSIVANNNLLSFFIIFDLVEKTKSIFDKLLFVDCSVKEIKFLLLNKILK